MIIYQTADGTFYTTIALFRTTVAERRAAWDADTQGSWEQNQYIWFHDWLIEAINTGVIRQIDVRE